MPLVVPQNEENELLDDEEEKLLKLYGGVNFLVGDIEMAHSTVQHDDTTHEISPL